MWLSAMAFGTGSRCFIKAFTTYVTATGFTMEIDSRGDFKFLSATATWVAYPANKPRVASGSFRTSFMGQPQEYNSAHESFGAVFERPPRVFVAVNEIYIDRQDKIVFEVGVDDVSATGMTWHLDVGNDSTLNSAGASYIALG